MSMQVTLRRAHDAEARAARRAAADAAREEGCDGLRPMRGIVNAIVIAVALDVLLAGGVLVLIRLI